MKIPIHKIDKDIIRISTLDVYNKADYKWDPQLKKTVYIGHKKKKKAETTEPEKGEKINIKKDAEKYKEVKININNKVYKEMTNQIDDIWDKVSERERQAIKMYTGDEYASINSYLRTGSSSSELIKKMTQNIETFLNKFELKNNIKVYRGQSNVREINNFDTENLKSNIGKVAKFESFVSTSLERDVAAQGNFLKLYGGTPVLYIMNLSKQKTKGAFLDGHSTCSREEEFLLQKNQDFIIKKIRKMRKVDTDNIYYEIELDQI